MVNVFLSVEKNCFKSKNSVEKFKKKVKEIVNEGFEIEFININIIEKDYLKEELIGKKEFKFDGFDDKIFVKLIDVVKNKETSLLNFVDKKSDDKKIKVKEKLREYLDNRSGKKSRDAKKEINEMKNTVDKQLLKKYDLIKRLSDAPIIKPNILLTEYEKYRDHIEIFASGYLEICKNERIQNLIVDYYRIISEKVKIDILSKDKFIAKYYNVYNNQKLENINFETFNMMLNSI